MMHRWFGCLICFSMALCAGSARAEPPTAPAGSPVKTVRPDGTPNPAAWMAAGSFGVMTHYLPVPRGADDRERLDDLNRLVDGFELDSFIRQLDETGADWLILTLGQTTGYVSSPNPVYEAAHPGHAPRRDVVLEIAQRLAAVGKRLILYYPSEGDPSVPLGPRDEHYLDRYFEFIRHYSLKFGPLCHGWWFDSCTPHPDDYWLHWLAAAKAGNSAAVVAFSGAEFCSGGPIAPRCLREDYHAGEIHLLEDSQIRRDFLWPPEEVILSGGKLRRRGQQPMFYLPDGPFVDNVQWHGLLPIDLSFNPAIPNQFCHYTDAELLEFVRRIKAVGGAITINVPIDAVHGRMAAESQAQLVRLSAGLRP